MSPRTPATRQRRGRSLSLVATIVVILCVPRPVSPQTAAVPSPTAPAYVVARMGLSTTESQARHEIAFRPFAPARRIVATALLPPFHGADARANRGIAFEYTDAANRLYALAEWPANGGSLSTFEPLENPPDGCPSGRTFPRGAQPNGIVWSTPHGLIMTLQSDGKNDGRTLQTEWQKLIRRGVCR